MQFSRKCTINLVFCSSCLLPVMFYSVEVWKFMKHTEKSKQMWGKLSRKLRNREVVVVVVVEIDKFLNALVRSSVPVQMTAWENSRHLPTLTLVFPPNDLWGTSVEIPYWWLIRVMLLIGWSKFSANQKDYPHLASIVSSVLNLCAHSSGVFFTGKPLWWRHEPSAVFSGYSKRPRNAKK